MKDKIDKITLLYLAGVLTGLLLFSNTQMAVGMAVTAIYFNWVIKRISNEES